MPCYDCCICERPFKFGPHVYDGRPITRWCSLMICRECDCINHDGVVAETHPHLIPRLESLGIKFVLDENGLIIVPTIGSS